MVKKKSKQKAGSNTIALNKKARHEYFIDDEIEAGMELQGWEVKALRQAKPISLKATFSCVTVKLLSAG